MDLMIFSKRQKRAKVSNTLDKIASMVNWQALLAIVKKVDKSRTSKGGRKPLSLELKLRMLFLQHLYNLSDQELEDQLIDRLSFQRFSGLGLEDEIPNFITLWRFKESLLKEKLMDRIFSSIVHQLELQGLVVKKGILVDATIVNSSTRPLSKDRRKKLENAPGKQIDTDARSTHKNGKDYFGYKGHIGLDMDSKIIRKRVFTDASSHDSKSFEDCLSGDESFVCADKAYANQKYKRASRALGDVHYGILDKASRGKKLSKKQEKRNKQMSKIRAAVEHPFAYMKKTLKYSEARAKTKKRNSLVFDMNCILYNVLRGAYLLKQTPALVG